MYAIVGEANGQAMPMAFIFTTFVDGPAAHGAKERVLQVALEWISNQCPNIIFTLSDKDVAEINAFQIKFPRAKHQLCHWHVIRYLEERLAEDKPPAKYDPRVAHRTFSFIDPTWAPGVTSGWLDPSIDRTVVTNRERRP